MQDWAAMYDTTYLLLLLKHSVVASLGLLQSFCVALLSICAKLQGLPLERIILPGVQRYPKQLPTPNPKSLVMSLNRLLLRRTMAKGGRSK